MNGRQNTTGNPMAGGKMEKQEQKQAKKSYVQI